MNPWILPRFLWCFWKAFISRDDITSADSNIAQGHKWRLMRTWSLTKDLWGLWRSVMRKLRKSTHQAEPGVTHFFKCSICSAFIHSALAVSWFKHSNERKKKKNQALRTWWSQEIPHMVYASVHALEYRFSNFLVQGRLRSLSHWVMKVYKCVPVGVCFEYCKPL